LLRDKLPVVLLDDLPATSDAFGGHQAIAKAISDLISTESGGRAVALAGKWGSGKSTVVKLLTDSLLRQEKGAGQPEIEIFVFDAWTHEGDPLRRSFLERLIMQLQSKKWLEYKRWQKRLEELAKRRKTTDTTSSPIFTPAGVVALILAYCAPLAAVLVANWHNFYHKRTILAAGVALYLSPLIVALSKWCVSRKSPDGHGFNLFGMLFNRTVENTVTETFETGDPTSVEFQQVFQEVAEEALGSTGARRRLVIVIDNLDRVDAHDALELWSTISALIDFSSAGSRAWTQQVWTLVPFDETGIKRLWKSEASNLLGEAFLAKTFQVRFNVPAPLLSDWSAFLESQLRTAFPKHDQREFYGISRIFSSICVSEAPPNPRDIKNFVNQIGATYRTEAEAIPLASHATMAALNCSITGWKPGANIPHRDEIENYTGIELEADLAALYYNVSKNRAQQAIFGGHVQSCLLKADMAEISALIDRPGIEHVILGVIREGILSWAKNEPISIGRAAFACEAGLNRASPMWNEIWHRLEEGAQAVESFSTLDSHAGAGLGALIRRRQDDAFSQGIVWRLAATRIPDRPAAGALKTWYLGVAEVMKALTETGKRHTFEEHFRLGHTSAEFLSFMNTDIPPEASGVVQNARPGFEANLIITDIVNRSAGNALAGCETAITNIIKYGIALDWQKFVEATKNRIQQGQLQIPDLGTTIKALFRLTPSVASAVEALASSAQSGWLLHYLAFASNGNFHPATASCILGMLVYHPEASNPGSPGNAQQGRAVYRSFLQSPKQKPEVHDALIADVGELIPARNLLQLIKANKPSRGILLEALRDIASGQSAWRFLSVELVVDEEEFLRSELTPEIFDRILEHYLSTGELIDSLVHRPFSVALRRVYESALNSTSEERLRHHLNQALLEATKQDWTNALESNGDLVKLVVFLQETGPLPPLGLGLGDALSDLADRALAGTQPKVEPRACSSLIAILNPDHQETLKRHLLERVAEANANLGVFLKYFAESIYECTLWSEFADKLARQGLPRILERADAAELRWASEIFEKCPQLYRSIKPPSLNLLRERVKAKLNETLPAEITLELRRLGEALQLKSPRGGQD
jgi:hypothetical protein